MLLSIKQLQEELKISRGTVFRLINDGLPTVRISERVLRFDREEVMKWFKNKAV